MVYLKTIFSADNEIKFIKMQLAESRGYVDKIIVCEFDRTHTGYPREFTFSNYLQDGTFSREETERVIYIQGNVGKGRKVRSSMTEPEILHKNERLYRGYFAHHMKLKPDDIIISVDADEIIFRRKYAKILSHFRDRRDNPVLLLRLYQFYYRPTYLWENMIFTAPTVCRVKVNRFHYPAQWRYEGSAIDDIVGCHFSWNLTVDEMIVKLHSYSHTADYKHLASRDIMEDAVRNKKYPFDPAVDFRIREVNHLEAPEYYPDTYGQFCGSFDYLYK